MKLELAVTVAGTGEQLLELNAAVTEQKSRVTAAILAEAQGLILDGAKSGEVLTDLPRRARMAINGILGRDEFPEPVTEVLILSLAMQG